VQLLDAIEPGKQTFRQSFRRRTRMRPAPLNV
jgi:hypothetical protein